MGSLGKACIAGFLCRLCSEIHRTVIHIYGDKGMKLGLAQKLNDYLLVTVTPTDPLPKTICEYCMGLVKHLHDLIVKMTKSRVQFALLRQIWMQLGRYSQSTNSQSEALLNDINNSAPTNEIRVRRRPMLFNNVNIMIDSADVSSSNDSDENIHN